MLLGPRKVQLIDATQWFEPLRKNLGKKNRELSEEDIQRICDTFLAFEETAQSKIFPNRAFGYWKVTVERPLPLAVDLSPEQRLRFRAACREAQEEPIANVADRMAEALGAGPHLDFNRFTAAVETDITEHGVKLTSKRNKLLQTSLAARSEAAEPVIKIHALPHTKLSFVYGQRRQRRLVQLAVRTLRSGQSALSKTSTAT